MVAKVYKMKCRLILYKNDHQGYFEGRRNNLSVVNVQDHAFNIFKIFSMPNRNAAKLISRGSKI